MNDLKAPFITGLAIAGMLALGACGSPAPASTAEPEPSASSGAVETPSASATAADEKLANTGSYTLASFALPINEKGTKLGTIEGKSFSVDVFQVATDVASKDSMSSTRKPRRTC